MATITRPSAPLLDGADYGDAFPNSRKVFVEGKHGIRVPFREITLSDGEPALRVYDTETGVRQQIWWTGINEDVTDVATVDFGSISIELPQAVPNLSDVVLDGPGSDDVEEHTEDGRVFTWTMENMGEGDTLWGRVEFPAMVNATAPAWQESVDEQRLREQDRESRDALRRLMMAGAGLLALTAGGVGVYGLWYMRGRDPGIGEVASYLSEPPDDLPPGAAHRRR